MWLKQSTAATIVLGPFVDSGDGVTPETALTISQADIRLSKNGGAFAQTNNATGATHMENGNYSVPLDTTDTGTLGRLRVAVYESGALPTWQDFMILPANIYDSIVAGSDNLQVDTTQWAGAATDSSDVALAAAPSNFAALAITAGGAVTAGTVSDKTGYSLSSAGIQAIWDALTAALTTVGSIGKLLVDRIDAAISSRAVAGDAMDLVAGAVDSTAIATGAIDADALSADAGTELGVAVWASATRTLTSFGALVTDITAALLAVKAQVIAALTPVNGDNYVSRMRGDRWSVAWEGLGDLTGVDLILTLKPSNRLIQPDIDATLQVRKNNSGLNEGLLYLNGSSSVTAAWGSLTITSVSNGDVTLALNENASKELAPMDYVYDISKYTAAAGPTTLVKDVFNVEADVTRGIS